MVVRVSPVQSGGGSAAGGVTAIILGVVFCFIGFVFPPLFFVGCILFIVGIIMASTAGGGGGQAVVIQQPAMMTVPVQPVVQRVVQRPVAPRPMPVPRPMPRPLPKPAPSKARTTPPPRDLLILKARNLEKARDFEGAAKAYQDAGMYEEAGRIRQEFLEDSQPVVQIGQLGDTVLNDSVMMTSESGLRCPSCGASVEENWKICPHCSSAL